MKPADYAFFKENGYVSLGKILSDAEVAHFVHVFDQDRTEVEDHWYRIGHYQTVNCDALLTSPEFDDVIRHPIVMDCLHTLMGNAPCFSEVCIRHMAPYDGELNRGWHRDGPRHWLEHPLRIGFMQLMLYLTDVDETTHCFSLSPESVDAEILETDAQLARGGIVDLYGPAGTADPLQHRCFTHRYDPSYAGRTQDGASLLRASEPSVLERGFDHTCRTLARSS